MFLVERRLTMGLNEALLESLRSFSDERSGLRERFITPTIGGKPTVGVLSAPIRPASDFGWIICHSFAMEQVWLQPLEVALARGLAIAGFHALRFHCQGYGDSEGSTSEIGLEAHVRDCLDAIRVLRDETGASNVGLVGARVGGTVAALAADRSDATRIVLWNPVVDGRRYVDALTRAAMVTELSSSSQVRSEADDVDARFAEAGILDVQGFPITRGVMEEFTGFNLLQALTRFRGEALIIQVSRTTRPRPDLEQLRARIETVGGQSSIQVLQDPEAWRLGQQRYYAAADGKRKEDKQEAMSEALVTRTTRWAANREASSRVGLEAGA
jgi:pimeloyl-ACP methyl ester carboxylesterase